MYFYTKNVYIFNIISAKPQTLQTFLYKYTERLRIVTSNEKVWELDKYAVEFKKLEKLEKLEKLKPFALLAIPAWDKKEVRAIIFLQSIVKQRQKQE